jgi:hypothetical protein
MLRAPASRAGGHTGRARSERESDGIGWTALATGGSSSPRAEPLLQPKRYAPHMSAREQGSTSEEASAAAGRYMDR